MTRPATMRRNGDHQQLSFVSAIHDAEGKALHQRASGSLGRTGSSQGVTCHSFDGRFDSCLETDAGACPGIRVVPHLVQQFRFGLRQDTNSDHFAMARVLAKTSSAGRA